MASKRAEGYQGHLSDIPCTALNWLLVKERSPKRLPEVVARGKKERVHRARSEPGRDINAVTENSSVNHVGTDRGPCLEALSLPVAFRAIQCDGPASWRAFLLWHDLYATFQ